MDVMKKQREFLLWSLIIFPLLASCSRNEVPNPALTPTLTSSATSIYNQTDLSLPTPTEPIINEHDLKPNHIQEISQEFMGVQINASLLVDESLAPVITKVTVPDKVFAEFIARTIFKVWWIKGTESQSGVQTEEKFQNFMSFWAKAQETNDRADWEKVQINNVWANDLNDGNGYVQEPYTIWLMFNGEAPEGVIGIENFTIAIVKAKRVENVTAFSNNAFDQGYGTNLDLNELYIYAGLINNFQYTRSASILLSNTVWWLRRNNGDGFTGYTPDQEESLARLLINGGLEITPFHNP